MKRFSWLMVLLIIGVLSGQVRWACADELPKVQTFDSHGVKIAYYVQGEGEAVVLIHGWLSSARINWMLPGTYGLLAKNYKVIAMDVRGHGQSDKPMKLEAYGPELVEDVVRLLDHLQIQKAHIVGYSMGGIIAAKFLVKHPERVLTGTLCGAGWLKEGSMEQRMFAGGGRDGKPTGLCFKSLAELTLTQEEVKGIHVPVRLIIGEEDGLKKLYVDPLQSVRTDWKVAEIPGATHITCIMKGQFQEAIAAWLKKNAK